MLTITNILRFLVVLLVVVALVLLIASVLFTISHKTMFGPRFPL